MSKDIHLSDCARGQPIVIDDDNDEIIVSLDGRELRGWNYADCVQRIEPLFALPRASGVLGGNGERHV